MAHNAVVQNEVSTPQSKAQQIGDKKMQRELGLALVRLLNTARLNKAQLQPSENQERSRGKTGLALPPI
jgi:hypothetical protein